MSMIAFLDTETTGLDPAKATVIEVAIIKRNLTTGEESRFHRLIKPTEQEIADAHPKALEVNGWAADPSRWDTAPSMVEVGPEVVAFLKGVGFLVGHNVSFDESMLMAAFARHGVKGRIPHHKIDTVQLAREHLFPKGLKRASMDAVRDFLGWSKEGAHTAMKDTEDALRLFDLTWRGGPTGPTSGWTRDLPVGPAHGWVWDGGFGDVTAALVTENRVVSEWDEWSIDAWRDDGQLVWHPLLSDGSKPPTPASTSPDDNDNGGV